MINSVYFLGCYYRVFDPGGERVLPEQGRRNREATFQSNLRLQENLGVKVVQLSLEEEVVARVLQLRWSSGLYMTTWASIFFHKCLTPQSNGRSNGAIWVFDPGGDVVCCEGRFRRPGWCRIWILCILVQNQRVAIMWSHYRSQVL
jgi:hypothetical protein